MSGLRCYWRCVMLSKERIERALMFVAMTSAVAILASMAAIFVKLAWDVVRL